MEAFNAAVKVVTVGGVYECFVSGRRLVVKILAVVPFGSGVKIVFQDARRPGRKMERYSPHDFREIAG